MIRSMRQAIVKSLQTSVESWSVVQAFASATASGLPDMFDYGFAANPGSGAVGRVFNVQAGDVLMAAHLWGEVGTPSGGTAIYQAPSHICVTPLGGVSGNWYRSVIQFLESGQVVYLSTETPINHFAGYLLRLTYTDALEVTQGTQEMAVGSNIVTLEDAGRLTLIQGRIRYNPAHANASPINVEKGDIIFAESGATVLVSGDFTGTASFSLLNRDFAGLTGTITYGNWVLVTGAGTLSSSRTFGMGHSSFSWGLYRISPAVSNITLRHGEIGAL